MRTGVRASVRVRVGVGAHSGSSVLLQYNFIEEELTGFTSCLGKKPPKYIAHDLSVWTGCPDKVRYLKFCLLIKPCFVLQRPTTTTGPHFPKYYLLYLWPKTQWLLLITAAPKRAAQEHLHSPAHLRSTFIKLSKLQQQHLNIIIIIPINWLHYLLLSLQLAINSSSKWSQNAPRKQGTWSSSTSAEFVKRTDESQNTNINIWWSNFTCELRFLYLCRCTYIIPCPTQQLN